LKKENIILKFVLSYLQLAEIFTKSLGEDQFNFIQKKIGILKINA